MVDETIYTIENFAVREEYPHVHTQVGVDAYGRRWVRRRYSYTGLWDMWHPWKLEESEEKETE